jgi:hypothetical protein
VVREPEHLDESIRDRMARTRERVELPPAPADMRSRINMGSGQTVIDLPPPGQDLRLIAQLVFSVAIAVMTLLFFGGILTTAPIPDRFRWPALAVIGIVFVCGPVISVLIKMRKARPATRVTASRAALTVAQGSTVTEIPGDELEELSVSGRDVSQLLKTQPDGSLVIDSSLLDTPEASRRLRREGQPPVIPKQAAGLVAMLAGMAPNQLAIVARSDQVTVSFGSGLSGDELAFLLAAILKTMAD